MKRIAHMVIMGLLLGAVALGVAAKEAPCIALHSQATLTKDRILLRDVARLPANAPEALGELVLGNAPWPGRARQVSRVLLKVRMASAGYELAEYAFAGPDVCMVRVASMQVKAEDIAAAAERCVRSCFPEGGAEVQVRLARMPSSVAIAQGPAPELRASIAGTGRPLGNVRVDVSIVRGGVVLQRVPVALEVSAFQKVAVARSRINPGEEFTGRNTVLSRRETTDVRGGAFADFASLVGKVAARPIHPGAVIASGLVRDAEQPLTVRARQRVFLVVQTRTLRIVTLGRALNTARRGEPARAMNLSSGREVAGIAADDGIIRIMLGGVDDEN